MPSLGEHKTVQARILEYAEAIGWMIMSCEEAEQWCRTLCVRYGNCATKATHSGVILEWRHKTR